MQCPRHVCPLTLSFTCSTRRQGRADLSRDGPISDVGRRIIPVLCAKSRPSPIGDIRAPIQCGPGPQPCWQRSEESAQSRGEPKEWNGEKEASAKFRQHVTQSHTTPVSFQVFRSSSRPIHLLSSCSDLGFGHVCSSPTPISYKGVRTDHPSLSFYHHHLPPP